MKCPNCKNEVLKAAKEWDYSVFRVKFFHCDKCRQKFKAYFKEGKLSHTIP